MISQQRVLIIGAGASGLAAIKSCKEECLKMVCYEKTENYGGRWRYTENYNPGAASVMKSTVCNSSKEIGAFSDFSPPTYFPNYMHHSKMLEYLTLYGQKFDLFRHIEYQREVIRIVPSSAFDDNGKWVITSTNSSTASEITEEFDCIMICTGRLSHPRLPEIANQNVFKGKILHSQALKTASSFENLKVVVVGSGNSAIDAAVDISTVAEQVFLSTRKGFWVFPKVGPKGLPFDLSLLKRDVHLLKNISSSLVNHYTEQYLETKVNHSSCKIKPSHRALDKRSTINDDLPDKIITGRILIKGGISRFAKNGVYFAHEDNVTDADAVVFATGYSMEFRFLDNEIYRDNTGHLNLYKKVFPMNLKHPTLAFIGFVETSGPQIPVSENQTRWASRIFAKKIQLPPNNVIASYMKTKCEEVKENKDEIMEDYIQYMDEVADEYGVKPNLSALFFKDLNLFFALFNEPFLPYQYRLSGPHCSYDARSVCLKYKERVIGALKTRFTENNTTTEQNQLRY